MESPLIPTAGGYGKNEVIMETINLMTINIQKEAEHREKGFLIFYVVDLLNYNKIKWIKLKR